MPHDRDAVRFPPPPVSTWFVPEARFVLTRAHGQPALAVYSRDEPNDLWRASGLLVVTPRGAEVAALTRSRG